MFIGPCIIAIVDEWKTNLMSLAILFHLLCAQNVSDINISIFRSLRLCWWITTSVVLFSVRCVLELLLRLVFGGVRFAGWSTCWAHNKWNKIEVTSSWSFILQVFLDVSTWFLSFLGSLLKRYSSPVTGLEWLRGFQDVKFPRLHDNVTGWW